MKMNITTTDLIQFACPLYCSSILVSGDHSFSWSGCCRMPLRFLPICSSLDNPSRWNSINNGRKRASCCRKAAAKEDVREGRPVQCEVEVISWRERRIKAELLVNADVKSVWKALTDYERLADFVPNLVSSGRIPCPYPGRIWLEQRGLQRALYWHIEARVVLDLQELKITEKHMELNFCMVEGDFKKFEGKWSVRSGIRPSTATLCYEVNVIPTFNFPAIFLERIIRSDLPVNFLALACRSESNFHTSKNGLVADSLFDTIFMAPASVDIDGTALEKKLLSTCASVDINGTALEKKLLSTAVEVKEKFVKSTFGPWFPSISDLSVNLGVFGKLCKLDRSCVVDEVHLRRFDGLLENGGVHRGVVASITVKAPIREVWITLTNYEKLPEIVPNLAISKVLSRENHKVRILQEGCKGLLYMVLHARVVLDLCEKLEEEISFRQVEGDFDFFHGKWTLEQLGSHHTLLKYVVKTKMHQNSFLSEAIMEEVIYEDLPSNLCAIRDFIENIGASASASASASADGEFFNKEIHPPASRIECDVASLNESADVTSCNCNSQSSSRQRPRVPGLQTDIEILKSELLKFIAKHGQEGFMPMRKQLRKHGRVDIEKAITRMGGFRKLSSFMNLSLAYKQRKPKGFWDNLENLEEEINGFQRSWGMDPSFMPSRKSFERAGRYDIARALEKWGGLHEVSRLLSLNVRHPKRKLSQQNEKTDPRISVAVKHEQATSKLGVSQSTEKWLTELKDFDINWVE